MTEENKSRKTQVIVALVGLVGVLGTAIISNIDRIFPQTSNETEAAATIEGSEQPETFGGDSSSDSDKLPAPNPAIPECDSTIRTVEDSKFLVFEWEPVEGASTYSVEIDCFGCREFGRTWHSNSGSTWHVKTGLGLRSLIYSSKIHTRLREEGGLAIRWRPWALDDNAVPGTKSNWCKVSFFGN